MDKETFDLKDCPDFHPTIKRMSSIRFAVAGFKHFHILSFVQGMHALSNAKLVGIFDGDPKLREMYEREFKVPGFSSIDELVEKTSPEIVGLAVENGRKAAAIQRITELGCHVLSDKPLVTTLEHLDLVEDAAARHNRQVGLMLLQRYDGPLRAVRSRLQSGALGRLVNFVSLAPHKLRPENRPAWMFDAALYGGVLNDLAIHDIDVMRWFWGHDPVAVTAVEGCLRFTSYENFTDHAEAFFEFADSSTAMVRADWLTPDVFPTHGDGRQILECTEGTIEVQAAPDIHTVGEGTVHCDWWDRPREELPAEPSNKSLYAEFVDLCRGGEVAELLPDDAFRSTRLALYAAQAARSKSRINLSGKL